MTDKIPLVNLKRQYRQIQSEVRDAIDAVLDSQSFIQGDRVRAFESEFSSALETPHGIACGNGTAALSLILEALGIGFGDEVITVAHTFFATAEAICNVGATPVFVDIDPESYTMDPAAVESAITSRTKAIVPVHIYGTPCAMDAILEVAQRKNLLVIEDAAQSHLALYGARCTGTMGDAGAFSFYPGKNLGAYGDAGFIAVNDDALAKKLKSLRDHGRLSKYEHQLIGYNQRMDEIQGAVLSVKLLHLPEWSERRRQVAALYSERLRAHGFRVMRAPEGSLPVYHLFVVEVSNREQVIRGLAEYGIATGIHYPVPLHLQPALNHLGYSRDSLPVTEAAAERVLSLPICGAISDEEVERVCDAFLAIAQP